ncbi:MAG: hypothetical protein IPH76_16760 [Xanthomonadales bacterium]|nr:hypothetical protein [Xanthomonadales bacterium]
MDSNRLGHIGGDDQIEGFAGARRFEQAPHRERRQRCVGDDAQRRLSGIAGVGDRGLCVEHDRFDVGRKLREQALLSQASAGWLPNAAAKAGGLGHGDGRRALWNGALEAELSRNRPRAAMRARKPLR